MIYSNYYFTHEVPKDVPENLKSIIEDFHDSEAYISMLDGANYYKYKNTAILERKKEYWSPIIKDGVTVAGELLQDPYLANNKLCSGYVPLLIDQLNQYILSNEITFDEDTEKALGDETLINGEKLTQATYGNALESQQKSIGWTYFYIKDDVIHCKKIPSEEIIPIFNESENLTYVIRAYTLRVVNEEGEMEDASIVEVYDTEKITTYIKFKGDSDYKQWNCYNKTNQKYYITEKKTVNGEERGNTGKGFGVVPFAFIEFKGDGISVLDMVKTLVDIYDKVNSDFANNFEDFEDAVNIVKGYAGTDMKTLQENIKRYKAVLVEGDGSFERDIKEVPYLARKEFLQITNDLIFKQGMGVDTSQVGDGNITNVVIKSRYKSLDIKAEWFGTKIKEYYKQVREIINAWLNYKSKLPLEKFDITFNMNSITNDVEMMDALSKLDGLISKETIYKNLSIVKDIEAEFEQVEKERGAIELKDEIDI